MPNEHESMSQAPPVAGPYRAAHDPTHEHGARVEGSLADVRSELRRGRRRHRGLVAVAAFAYLAASCFAAPTSVAPAGLSPALVWGPLAAAATFALARAARLGATIHDLETERAELERLAERIAARSGRGRRNADKVRRART